MIDTILIDANKTMENCDSFISSRDEIFAEMASILEKHAKKCSHNSLCQLHEEFCRNFGLMIWEHHPIFWRTVLNRLTRKNNSEKVVQELYNAYLDIYTSRISLYPDVIPFLDLHSCKYKLGMVANGNSQRLSCLISRFDLGRFFRSFVISGDCPFGKPDPFLFKYALSELGSSSSTTVMIGDRYSTDISGAKALGIRTIHLSRSSKPFEGVGKPWLCPDAEIRDLSEVRELIRHEPTDWGFAIEKEHMTDKHIVQDAVVLCGGTGTRMKKLTATKQKCLLPLGGTPMLDYVVRTLASVGCKRIFFILGHRAENVKDFIGSGTQYGIEPVYVDGPFKGTLEATIACLSDVADVFYYIHANIIFPPRLLETLWHYFIIRKKSTLIIVPTSQDIKHARVQVKKDGCIKRIDTSGSAKVNFGDLYLGIAIYKKELFSHWTNHVGPGMTELVIESTIPKKKNIAALRYIGEWRHYESEQDYLKDKDFSPAKLIKW
jgi:HAD superfamily hydrolase (TIGR01549 family)